MEEGARLAIPGFRFGVHHGFLILVLAALGQRKEALAILAAEGAGLLGDPGAARTVYPLVVEALSTER